MNNRRTGIVLSYSYTFLNMIFGLFLSSFLLRVLGNFQYGLYQTISAFVSYLVVLEFGTGTVMCRNLLVARNSNDELKVKKSVATVFYMTITFAALILLVAVIFGFNIRNIYSATIPAGQMAYAIKMYALMIVFLLCSFFYQTISGIFIGYENYNVGSAINITKICVRTGTLVLVVCLFKYSIVIAIVDAVISLMLVTFSFLYCKKKYGMDLSPKYFDKAMLKESVPLCVAMLLQVIINQANNNVDKFVISIKMNMESVALYSISMYIYTMFSSLTTIPISMYMPQVTKSIKSGLAGKALAKTLVAPSRLIALIGGTVLFGFVAIGKQFIRIVYGTEYELTWIVAIIAMVPMLVNMTAGTLINVLDVLNKRQFRSYLLMVSTAINIVLTVWFVGIWGIVGAVIATAIGLLIGQIIMLNIYYYKALSINAFYLYRKAYQGILPVLFLASVFGYAVAFLLSNNYLAFLCGGVVFVLTELVGMLLFGFNDAEKNTVHSILKKILKKSERGES